MIAEHRLGVGDRVYVEGRLHTRKWMDDTFQDRFVTEIILSADGGELAVLGEPRALEIAEAASAVATSIENQRAA